MDLQEHLRRLEILEKLLDEPVIQMLVETAQEEDSAFPGMPDNPYTQPKDIKG
jgi:hypothetical protein